MDLLDKVIPKTGERIGRYEIIKELGRGGFGVVYLARQAGLEADVAIKLLIPQLSGQAQQMQILERFEQEARVIKQLEHPAALKVRDFGRWSGLPYLVTEFVRGRELADILREQGPLPPARVARIARQLLSCLAEAHHRGIVHRDLKPANIMIRDIFGEEDAVKVLDFGIAKVSDDTGVQTITGVRFGTPQYMSPEQCRGLRDLDGRVDIYALGLIIAECLTGQRVVQTTDMMGAFYAQASQDPVAFPPGLDHSPLWPVIYQATLKDRDQRYPDALSMRQALDHSMGRVESSYGASGDSWPAQPSAHGHQPSPPPSAPLQTPQTPSWSAPNAPVSAPVPSSQPISAPSSQPAPSSQQWSATSASAVEPAPVEPAPVEPAPVGPRSKAPLLVIAALVLLGGGFGAFALLSGGDGTDDSSEPSTTSTTEEGAAADDESTPPQQTSRVDDESTPPDERGPTELALADTSFEESILSLGIIPVLTALGDLQLVTAQPLERDALALCAEQPSCLERLRGGIRVGTPLPPGVDEAETPPCHDEMVLDVMAAEQPTSEAIERLRTSPGPLNCLTQDAAATICDSLQMRLPSSEEALAIATGVPLQSDLWQWTSSRSIDDPQKHVVFGGPAPIEGVGPDNVTEEGFTAVLRSTATPPFVGVRCTLDADTANVVWAEGTLPEWIVAPSDGLPGVPPFESSELEREELEREEREEREAHREREERREGEEEERREREEREQEVTASQDEDLPEALSTSDVSRTIRRYSRQLSSCRERSSLPDGDVLGVDVNATIEPDGRVSRASSDSDDPAADCVVDIVRGMRFSRFAGESMTFTYPFRIR